MLNVTNTPAYFGYMKIIHEKHFIVQALAKFKTYQRIFSITYLKGFGSTLGVVEWDLK
jgi:hypothetical protein